MFDLILWLFIIAGVAVLLMPIVVVVVTVWGFGAALIETRKDRAREDRYADHFTGGAA